MRERSIAGWDSWRSRFQRFAGGQCAVFPFGRELGGVHQPHAWRHIQAACAAHHQQALNASGLDACRDGAAAPQKFVVQVGMRPAWVVGAGHRVHPRTAWATCAASVASACTTVRPSRGELGRVAGQGGHAVAALQQFIQQCGAHKAGGANQCDVHGVFLQGVKMLQVYFDAAIAVEG